MKIVILGNGISGITAARHLRKGSEHEITVISSESKYFFSRTALMYIYMGHMTFDNTQPYEKGFWEKNRIELLQEHVKSVDFEEKQLEFTSGRTPLAYDKLILAVGSSPNKFGWPGQDLKGVSGLYTLQDLGTMEQYSKNLERAVIVGGGLIGIEMAEMFHSRGIPVTFLVREKSFWDHVLPPAESEMVNLEIIDHHIDLRLEEELDHIIGDEEGKVKALCTKSGEEISCGFVGLTPGVHPNVSFLRESALDIDKGILVDNHLRTNIEDVFAIGDCAQMRTPRTGRRPIEAIWYTGRMMGELVAHNILKPQKTLEYDPGIWFNSAKFFTIEYQIYGEVPTTLPETMESLYWQSEDGKKSVRINFDKREQQVRGFHLMGVRFRQQVCEKWLHEKTSIDSVLSNLELAAFDPEFYKNYEQGLRKRFKDLTGRDVAGKSSRKLNPILQFLKSKSS